MLSFFGFTTAGVAAGSFASAWQSAIGNVAAGSWFAWYQSIAASGIWSGVVLPAAGVLATSAIVANIGGNQKKKEN